MTQLQELTVEVIEEQFGLGGLSNYTDKQRHTLYTIISTAQEEFGNVEFDWLGDFFKALSETSATEQTELMEEIEQIGY